ncbi:hypothetical protein B296_00010256, partial [Ensete ventricosum]
EGGEEDTGCGSTGRWQEQGRWGSSGGDASRRQEQGRKKGEGGVDCSKVVAAIGGRRGSDVHDCCGGGKYQYDVRDDCCCVQFVAGRDQDSWQQTLVAGCDVNILQRKIATGCFLPKGSLLAMIKEDGNKRSLLAALGSKICMLQFKG